MKKLSKNQQPPKKKKLLELLSDYRKVAGYKVNIQKLTTFLYTSNENLEFKNKYTIPFTLVPKKKKRILRHKFYKICIAFIWGKLNTLMNENKEYSIYMDKKTRYC